MSAIKKLASQTAIYGFSSILGRLVTFGLTPLYTGNMGTGEYGVFSDLFVFVTYFLVILTFGMETAFFRFGSENKQDSKSYNQAFIFVIIMAFAFLLLFTPFHKSIATLANHGDRPMLMLLIIIIIFIDVMIALPMAKLRFDERPKVFAAITLSTIFISLGLNIYFYLIQGQSTADYIFISTLVASIFRLITLLLISSPLMKFAPDKGMLSKVKNIKLLPSEWKLDKESLKPMMDFGFFIMIAGLLGMINQNSDVNFIKRVWGDTASLFHGNSITGNEMAGIFSANKKLAVLILLVTQAFRYAAEPFFFKHAKERDSREVFAKVFHYFMIAALAVFLLVSSFSYELVSFELFGYTLIDSHYWEGLNAVPLVLFSFVIWGGYINISIWYKITKQVRFGILFSAVGTAIIIILNLSLIPFLGYIGSAIAMIGCFSTMLVLCYFFGQKYYPIPYNFFRTFIYVAIAVLAFFINLWIGEGELFVIGFWYKLLVCAIAALSVFILEKINPIFGIQTENKPRENSEKPS